VSGHPGRKLGSKNKPKKQDGLTEAEQIAWEESFRSVPTSSGEMEANRAVNRAQIKTAAQGGTNAQKAHLARLDAIAQKKHVALEKRLAEWETYVQTAEDMLDRATPEQRLALEKALLPHPADVEVDFSKGEVRFSGPVTSLDRRHWKDSMAAYGELRTLALRYRKMVEKSPRDVGLQTLYFRAVDCFLSASEDLSPRYRLAPLPKWTKRRNIPFWFDRGFYPQPPEI
jgi:hypothetical protein